MDQVHPPVQHRAEANRLASSHRLATEVHPPHSTVARAIAPAPQHTAAHGAHNRNDALAWIEGNADYLAQAAAGGAHFAYHQVVTHPWETAGIVGLGVVAVAASPVLGAVGVAGGVVTGIDIAVTAGSAALAAYGTARGISDLNRAAHSRAAVNAHTVLMHPDGYSHAELEAARRVVRDNLGRGTFETSMGALGIAGTALSGLRLVGTVGKFTARVPKVTPEEVPPPPPPPPPPIGGPTPHPEVANGAPPPPPPPEVPNANPAPPNTPPSTETSGANGSSGPRPEHGGTNSDATRHFPTDQAGRPQPIRTEIELGGRRLVETVYPEPQTVETPIGQVRFTRSEESPTGITLSNPEGLGLPGNPVHVRFNERAETIHQIWENPGEVSTPYGAMSPNSIERISDANDLSHLETEYLFWGKPAGSAPHSDPLSSLDLLRVDHAGKILEIYNTPVSIDGFSNVISREISPDKQTLLHILDDLSEHTSVRQPDGSYALTGSTEALRTPGSTDFNFAIGVGSLVDHFQPAQDLGTPYGVMPVVSRETITDPGAHGTAYNFAPGARTSGDPLDSMDSLQVNTNGSVEENYVHPVKIDGVSHVVTRIISADKKSIRYVTEDGSVVTAVRRPDGSIVRRPPTRDPEA